EVAIGWFGPAEPDHPLGGSMWLAASLAVEEANEAGGVGGLPLRLAAYWSENPWGTGISRLTRALYTEHLWAVVGSVDSPSTHLAEQVAAKARLPIISPIATDASVNLAGVAWMFSCAPGDHIWAPALVDGAIASLEGGRDRLCVVVSTDHDSRLAADEVLKVLEKRERFPVRRLDIRPGQREFDLQIEALRESRPRAVLLVAGAEEGARMAVAIRRAGLDPPIFGCPRMASRRFLEIAGEAAEGVRMPWLVEVRGSDPRAADFVRRFSERAGREPDPPAILAYDAVRLLIEALEESGLNRARLRDALARLSPYAGIGGTIHWDPTGQNRRPVAALAVVRGGRFEPAGAGVPRQHER
ncbi:MAG: ABC transporter substrate-binding protein, partial [Planctomycetes bacterium]|nr:ABC transporter substrate-binding protein [Planctomycetota bacterium]